MMVDPDQGSPANWRTELTTDCLQSFTTIHYPFYTQIPFLHSSSLSLFVLPSYKRRTFPASSLSPPVLPSYKHRYPFCINQVRPMSSVLQTQIPFLYQVCPLMSSLYIYADTIPVSIKYVPCSPVLQTQILLLYQVCPLMSSLSIYANTFPVSIKFVPCSPIVH